MWSSEPKWWLIPFHSWHVATGRDRLAFIKRRWGTDSKDDVAKVTEERKKRKTRAQASPSPVACPASSPPPRGFSAVGQGALNHPLGRGSECRAPPGRCLQEEPTEGGCEQGFSYSPEWPAAPRGIEGQDSVRPTSPDGHTMSLRRKEELLSSPYTQGCLGAWNKPEFQKCLLIPLPCLISFQR